MRMGVISIYELCPMVSPTVESMKSVPTIAKVHDTILNFERCDTDNDDVEDIHLKYQIFKETLESVQDRIRHESQSRVECMNLLQKEAEKATNELLFRLHNEIFKRIDITSVELRNTLERASNLESRLNELRNETSISFMNELSLIHQQLINITKDFSDQCSISREIDDSILSRATQIGVTGEHLLSLHSNEMEKTINTLYSKIDKAILRLKNNQNSLYKGMKQELDALCKALELASQARKDSDECIVQAIDEMMNLLPKELHEAE